MKKLSLKREALAALSAEELVSVNGAALAVPKTLNVRECTEPLTQHTALDCLTRSGC